MQGSPTICYREIARNDKELRAGAAAAHSTQVAAFIRRQWSARRWCVRVGPAQEGGYPKAYLTHYMVDASVCYMQGSPGKAGERRRRCCLRGWGAPFLSGGSEKCRYRSGCCSQMPCGTSYTTWSDVGSTTSLPRPIASSAGMRARHRLADVRTATITRAPVATRCDGERSSVTIPAGSP